MVCKALRLYMEEREFSRQAKLERLRSIQDKPQGPDEGRRRTE